MFKKLSVLGIVAALVLLSFACKQTVNGGTKVTKQEFEDACDVIFTKNYQPKTKGIKARIKAEDKDITLPLDGTTSDVIIIECDEVDPNDSKNSTKVRNTLSKNWECQETVSGKDYITYDENKQISVMPAVMVSVKVDGNNYFISKSTVSNTDGDITVGDELKWEEEWYQEDKDFPSVYDGLTEVLTTLYEKFDTAEYTSKGYKFELYATYNGDELLEITEEKPKSGEYEGCRAYVKLNNDKLISNLTFSNLDNEDEKWGDEVSFEVSYKSGVSKTLTGLKKAPGAGEN